MNIKNQPLASDPFHLGKCSDIPKKSKQVLQLYILFKLPFFNLMLYSTSDFESRVCTFKKSEQEYDSRRFAYFFEGMWRYFEAMYVFTALCIIFHY